MCLLNNLVRLFGVVGFCCFVCDWLFVTVELCYVYSVNSTLLFRLYLICTTIRCMVV